MHLFLLLFLLTSSNSEFLYCTREELVFVNTNPKITHFKMLTFALPCSSSKIFSSFRSLWQILCC